MSFRTLFCLSAVILLAGAVTTAQADVPQLINYQGILTDPGTGEPVVGSTPAVISVYQGGTSMAGGTLVYTEDATLTTDDNGLFNHLIGSQATNADPEHTLSPSDFVTSDPLWVEVEIDGSPLLPRPQLVTVPYAMAVGTVDGSGGGVINGGISISGGELNLDHSSPGAGNILKGGDLFIHDFGTENTFIGRNAGNLTMTGDRNTASGEFAFHSNTTGCRNTASGYFALYSNTTGHENTASGYVALWNNTTGSCNTAVGNGANVSAGNLFNATAIGHGANVNASNKIRLGNSEITVIEGQVAYTFTSDKNDKENFRPVDGDEVLSKIRGLELTSWNYIGQDPQQFRHYGPVAQEFFAAFGQDDVGTIGKPTTINSGDMAGILMIAVQTLEKRTAKVEAIKAQNEDLRAQIAELHHLVDQLLEQNR